MAEVSEQPQQSDSSKQTAEKRPAKEHTAEKQPAKPSRPPHVSELDDILEHLMSLTASSQHLIESTDDISDQPRVQQAATAYAHALDNLPKALQLLNDYRRHGDALSSQAEQVQEQLISLRGGDDDALSSEEQRILYEAVSAKDTVIGVIQQLEQVMGHVRNQSHPLVSLISLHEPGFEEYAESVMQTIRVDWVSSLVSAAMNRVHALHRDMHAFEELKQHAEELQNVSAAA